MMMLLHINESSQEQSGRIAKRENRTVGKSHQPQQVKPQSAKKKKH
jgi:hypothetical protein